MEENKKPNESEYTLTQAEVCSKMNTQFPGKYEKISRLKDDYEIQKKKLVGRGNIPHWRQDDIDEIIQNKIKKIEEQQNKQKTVILVDEMGDILRSKLKEYIGILPNDCFVCKISDNNEWAMTEMVNPLVFLRADYYEDIKEMYQKEIIEGESTFLLSESERDMKKGDIICVPQLSSRWKKFIDSLRGDRAFKIEEPIEPFTNDNTIKSYKYFDLNNIHSGEHKHWDYFEKQIHIEDIPYFRAFIYSIFVAKNKYSRQVLWLKSEGENGRSTISRVLSKFGGDHFASFIKMQQIKDNKFWGTYFYGYRLIVFDDPKDRKILSDGIVKTITGNGGVSVEMKQSKFNLLYYGNWKVIVAENWRPLITENRSEESRLIQIDVEQPSEEDRKYMVSISQSLDDILMDEFPAYLNTCKPDYKRLCPDDGAIELSERLKKKTRECWINEKTILDNYMKSFFVFTGNGEYVSNEIIERTKNLFMEKNHTKIDHLQILNYFDTKGVEKFSMDVDGLETQCFKGITLNPEKWILESGAIIPKKQTNDESDGIVDM